VSAAKFSQLPTQQAMRRPQCYTNTTLVFRWLEYLIKHYSHIKYINAEKWISVGTGRHRSLDSKPLGTTAAEAATLHAAQL